MKIIVTHCGQESIDSVVKYIDGVVLGLSAFASRVSYYFNVDEIISESIRLKKGGLETFLLINRLFTEFDIKKLEKLFETKKLDSYFDYIIFSDLGLIITAKKFGFASKLIYQGENLLANIFDFNYFALEIAGAFISRELEIDDVEKIAKESKYLSFVNGFGYINMLASKRKLISSYFHKYNIKGEINNNLQIEEELREGKYFKIIEDDSGTYIFKAQMRNFFLAECLKETSLDYFYVDNLFIDPLFLLDSLKFYKKELPLSAYLAKNQSLNIGKKE